MEETRTDKRDEKIYEYTSLPKNVRQIGVPLPGKRIYLEDYVITYLKQIFVQTMESKIVVLLGKEGRAEAEEGVFCYGAMELDEPQLLEAGKIPAKVWNHVHESIRQHFSGAKVLGWACGVNVWNSEMDSRVRRLQRTEFADEGNVLFLWDLCEKEEKIFIWQRDVMKEQSGYYIYYEKNPQMQEYMLDQPSAESIEANYQDKVTSSIRHVMEEKEERRKNIQLITYCGAVAAAIAILFAAHTMLESTARIKNMEETVDALSEYVGQQQDEVETMARQTKQQIHQIDYESGETEKETAGKESSEKETAEQQAVSAQREESKKQSEDKKSDTKNDAASDSGSVKKKDEAAGEKSTAAPVQSQGQGASETDEDTAGEAMKHQSQSYIVQKGDTLSQIVWRHYHDLSYEKKVLRVNGIQDGDKIYEGQCIVLPRYKK